MRGCGPLHAIVLAGGRGERLLALVASYAGEPVPKQFCAFGRPRTLLRETVDRVRSHLAPASTVIVVDESQRHRAAAATEGLEGIRIVPQPRDRGTAAGVLLPLLCVLEDAPRSTVVVTPSDHGVRSPGLFREGIARAREAVEGGAADVVIMAARAEGPNPDYGWILPGRPLTDGLLAVDAFVEKPSPMRAEELWRSGGLWNTMVVVARAHGLWSLFRAVLPGLAAAFEGALGRRGPDREAYLREAYDGIEAWDFSRDVLGRAPRLSVLAWPADLGWTDLGTPERMQAWLADGAPAEPLTA